MAMQVLNNDNNNIQSIQDILDSLSMIQIGEKLVFCKKNDVLKIYKESSSGLLRTSRSLYNNIFGSPEYSRELALLEQYIQPVSDFSQKLSLIENFKLIELSIKVQAAVKGLENLEAAYYNSNVKKKIISDRIESLSVFYKQISEEIQKRENNITIPDFERKEISPSSSTVENVYGFVSKYFSKQ